MAAGWIKLHRSLLEHWVANNQLTLAAWVYLLLRANHEPQTRRLRSGEVLTIGRGQTLESQVALAGQWKVNRKTVRTLLSTLQNEQQITLRTTQHYTLITICNYDKYQGGASEEGQQIGHAQEDKNNKEGKKLRSRAQITPEDLNDLELPDALNTNEVRQSLKTWVDYKANHAKRPYKTIAPLKSILTTAIKAHASPQLFVFAVHKAISAEWAGIGFYKSVFDEFEGQKQARPMSRNERNNALLDAFERGEMADPFKTTNQPNLKLIGAGK